MRLRRARNAARKHCSPCIADTVSALTYGVPYHISMGDVPVRLGHDTRPTHQCTPCDTRSSRHRSTRRHSYSTHAAHRHMWSLWVMYSMDPCCCVTLRQYNSVCIACARARNNGDNTERGAAVLRGCNPCGKSPSAYAHRLRIHYMYRLHIHILILMHCTSLHDHNSISQFQ